MTTPHPGKKAQFYILVPQDTTEFTPESTPITFSLPAGTKFPDDLSQIMKKTQRYFTFKSIVLGETSPTCESCECSNCSDLVQTCQGEACKGFVSSTADIQCNTASCTKTNDTKYYLLPLYPTDSSLPHYNPKFKFVKTFPATKVDGDKKNTEIAKGLYPKISTFPPEFSSLPAMVLFSVSYPSLDIFNTEEKFNELYELCKLSGVLLSLMKEDQYAKHNNAILQQIVKHNKLSTSLLKQDIEKVAEGNRSIAPDREMLRQRQLLTKPPKELDSTLVKRLTATVEREIKTQGRSSKKPSIKPLPFPGFQSKENYEGEIELKELVIPVSEQDDTTPDILLTEEPKIPVEGKRKLSAGEIFGIVIACIIIFVIIFKFVYQFYSVSKFFIPKKKTQGQKQQSS